MRASFEDIKSRKGNQSFVAYRRDVPAFEFKWHYHPEYELTLITKGSGKRLVGDSYENFESGDLVLIGSNLPHTWVSDRARKGKSGAVVIQFSDEFIHSFLQWPEFVGINRLLTDASHGIFFPFRYSKAIIEKVNALPDQRGAGRITALLAILDQLSNQKPVKLASAYFSSVKGRETEKRINKVCQYIQKQAKGPISLDKTAALVHLSNSAFCRFFKRVTGKTFSDYVNDVRIGNACTLLTESDKSIATIAFETGFESLTYFNRIFLKKKNITPRDFRKTIGRLE
jgi:AraC-like DNA-binding protein